ncbi:MAG: response regulator transcription factor [Rikenellaceae bacterium]|nr:response regulator transcription factor [Rikenellaceae bacterium]
MSNTKSIRVAVVDDHQLFREGLTRLLDLQNGVEVAFQAEDGAQLLQLMDTHPVDVVLMDINMPQMNGIEATRCVTEQYPEVKVVALSMHGDREFYFEMVSAGAKGFLLKSSELHEVVEAVCTVMEGGSYFSEELLSTLVEQLHPAEGVEEDSEPLSDRETEVLIEVCRGLSNQEIADKLFISKRTVDKHRANILQKTGCRNTANLVFFAIKHHLIEL